MTILRWLIDLDIWLFNKLNQLPHPPFLNQIFLFFSFYPVIIWSLICLLLILLEQRQDQRFLLKFILALSAAGIVVSAIVKPLVARPRPDLQLGRQVVMVSEKPAIFFWNNDFAFPSGHAAIAFAASFILSREMKSKKGRFNYAFVFYGLATLTAFSRIYLGKHYPLDVIIGALIGVMVASYTWKLMGRIG